KIVIKADLVGSKCRTAVMSTVGKLQGIKSMDIDDETCTLTVVGVVDPVSIVLELKKASLAAAIVSVEDDKPAEEPPAPEGTTDTDDKEDHPSCECQVVCVQTCAPGCYYSPCVLPDCCYYRAFRALPYGCYVNCGESPASAGGECIIQ
ncbi:hypothetical protein EJB05_32086, partial [Eragrostis curvula]